MKALFHNSDIEVENEGLEDVLAHQGAGRSIAKKR